MRAEPTRCVTSRDCDSSKQLAPSAGKPERKQPRIRPLFDRSHLCGEMSSALIAASSLAVARNADKSHLAETNRCPVEIIQVSKSIFIWPLERRDLKTCFKLARYCRQPEFQTSPEDSVAIYEKDTVAELR